MKLLLENWRKYLTEETSCGDSLVVFMAGGPGSGKSSVISGLGLDNFVVLNPDDDFEIIFLYISFTILVGEAGLSEISKLNSECGKSKN